MSSLGLRGVSAVHRRLVPTVGKSVARQMSGEPSRKHYHERRLLKFSNEQLYKVVSSVENYKKFVPWCQESNVITKTSTGIEAELVVGFGYFKERYISVVELTPPGKVIATSKETSLFEYLRTEWRFSPSNGQPGRCWVTFEVEFKFKSALYNQAADMFLKEVVNKMVKAFEGRCKKEFPRNSASPSSPSSSSSDDQQVAMS
jgi:ribosome-associated toxin RatA of RatAB toxin-antitoxin module